MNRIDLYNMDCRDAMSLFLPDNSVDAIVCDPPYGLAFMGKKWDYDVPGVDIWAECLRVLKPGGHLLAFAGTRTQHRMAVRIEDAGFEIRDMIAWVYGCLDDATEVATEKGVMPHHKTKIGDRVLCYDVEHGEYSYQPILEIVEYDYSDTAYRLVGDFGEQVVSRNHRVIVERGGSEAFQLAETLECEARVPVLESLPALRKAVHDAHAGAGRAQQDMRAGMCGGDNRSEELGSKAAGNPQGADGGLRGVREAGMETGCVAAQGGDANVQPQMQWGAARSGMGDTCAQGAVGMVGGIGSSPRGAHDWAEQSGVEGWSDVSEQERCVCRSADQVRSMPSADVADGSVGRIRDGASVTGGVGDQSRADTGGVRSPHQPRCDGQPRGEPDAVCHERSTQGVRAWEGHRSAVVRVVPFHYTGKVWCLRVPTGAFVAVRNGVAFPTGNSGFPKSLDVSKAIDKAAGAERDVVGIGRGRTGNAAQPNGGSTFSDDAYQWSGVFDITAPATDAARQWRGWGTALKPALETVTFASKPYTDEQVRDIIQSNLFRLEARLWLLSSANAAGKSSTSNPSEYSAACAIAQWSADEITSTQADLCGQMGTSLFALATTTSLNIVSSWRRTLDESWSDGNTSTTETRPSMTTDWRTLKFSLSQITPASIIKACSLPGGFSANATTAESHFNASLLLLQSIRTLSATGRVMSQVQHEHQGAGVTPNLDPVVLARKPLSEGTVAANVLEHGTGALNIDGCRVAATDKTPAPVGVFLGSAIGPTGLRGERDGSADSLGRWPANLILSDDPEVLAGFPESASGSGGRRDTSTTKGFSTVGCGPSEIGAFTPYADAGKGSAARFFMQCKGDYNDAWQDLNLPQENANTAEQGSSQQRQAAVSALVLAVSSALPEGLLCSGLSMAPFTSATANELKRIADSVTQTIQSIDSRFWHESKPARLTLSLNHASDAEIQRRTDTTTITVNRWKSDGSAEPVTFSITPMSLEVGGKDCAPSMDGKRFMYCAKASRKDRNEGCEGMEQRGAFDGAEGQMGGNMGSRSKPRENHHPTVKPTDLMAYLCRLVTPPGGVVLDPFMGSGSTGKAAVREGFGFIGCEMDAAYFAIAQARIAAMKDAA